MTVYFLHTQTSADLVKVYNSGGSILATHSGYYGTTSLVTRVIDSPWLRIGFTSDGNNTGAGLQINFTQGTYAEDR